jgi:tetratricopeptide (TPR) repeat protein
MSTAHGTAHDKALAELHKAIKADAKDARALLRLAELHLKAKENALACDTYVHAAEVFTAQGFARRGLSAFAQALEVARKNALIGRVAPIAGAIARLNTHEKLPREAVSTLDDAVRFLLENGADADAARLLEERIALDDSEIVRVRLAETFFRLQQPARAVSQLQGVFARLYAQERRDEALEVAERLLGERCDVAVARGAAELYLARNRAGDPFLALAKLRICCSKDPTNVPTLQLLARAFDQAGHADKAERVRAEIEVMTGRVQKARLVVAQTIKAREESLARKVDAGWEDVEVDVSADTLDATADAAPRLDPSRASFWPVDEGPAPDASGSVVSVSINDVELIDNEAAPPTSEVREVSVFDTALECIEALVTQGRNDEALLLIARHLKTRPRNALLLERKAEIEEMKLAGQGAPAAVIALVRDSQRSIVTGARARAANA